jgi:4-hydroxy-tetrahydrodipicolinate synthase
MVLTPFTVDAQHVDHESLARLARTLVARGCTDLIALGVIAEPAALDIHESEAVLDTVRSAVPGTGLTAAVMVPSASAVGTLARRLRDDDTIMVPVRSPDSRALRQALIATHRASGGRSLVVQDYPDPTGVHIEVDDLLRAIEDLPFVCAIKCEARPTFWRIHRLAARTPVRLMAGLGGVGLLDDLRAGATAVACGITRPELLSGALNSWTQGRQDAAVDVVRRLAPLAWFETQPLTSVGIRKEHWRRQGVIASAAVRAPTLPYPEQLATHSAAHGLPDA